MPNAMSCEEIAGRHQEARQSHSERGLLTKVQQALLGNHNGGPLLYDKFLTIDSLQLHPPFDVAEQARLNKLTALDVRLAKRLRWCMDPLVGLGCALAAIILQCITEFFWKLRIQVITTWFSGPDEQTAYTMFMAWLMGSLVALALTLVACLGCWWQPTAASSGIPGVIAFLNGCEWAGALRGQVLIVKVFGTALACAAGLFVGPEGPMIHAGTIVGMLAVNRIIRPSLRRLGGEWGAKMDLELAREPLRYHFQAAAMGAGAGVAAAFAAPLAGTIFIVEEAASYFSKRLFFHSLLTCCFAVLITIIISDYLPFNIKEVSMYNATVTCIVEQQWKPLLLLQAAQVGIFCGVLAAFFNRLTVKLNTMRALQARRLGVKGRFVLYRFLEVAAITLATTAFSVFVPATLPCQDASLQNIFADSSGCVPQDWQAQLVAGSKAVPHSKDVFGPPALKVDKDEPRLAFIPAPGLYGVQFNPENCSRAVQLEPRCNITTIIATIRGPEAAPFEGLSEVNYCCGFRTLEELALGRDKEQGNFFSVKRPRSPITMSAEMWPKDVCPDPRKDSDNFQIEIPQYSPTAALLLANPRAVVRNLLTHGPQKILPAGELALYMFGYFILASFTSGAWVPSGLVLPMMIIGACAGRLSGIMWFEILGSSAKNPPIPFIVEVQALLKAIDVPVHDYNMDSGVLAMAGAAAFLSGSGSLMLFVVVLMLELTWDPFIIPVVLLAMVMARVVAAMLGSSGLYHELMEVQSFPYLAENEHWRQRCWLVRDVLDEDQRRGSYFASGGNWADETDIDINGALTSHTQERQARQLAAAANGSRPLERVSSEPSNIGLHSMQHSSASLMMLEAGATESQAPSELRSDAPRPRSKEWQTGTLIYLKAHSTAAEIENALKKVLDGDERPVANAFPVVEDDGGVLCGCVYRSSLEGLLRAAEAAAEGRPTRRLRNQPRDSLGRSLVANYESELQVSMSPSFPSASPGLSGAGSGPSDLLDVAAVMDASPFTVAEEAPVTQARMLFRQLGLRHLVVIDRCCRPVGILTRKSLMPWRTPWREHSFIDSDTFLETRAMHSPMGSPMPSRRAVEQEGP